MEFLKQILTLYYHPDIIDMGDFMLESIENLQLINIYEGFSAHHADFKNRPSHGFIFKLTGESVYTFKDKNVRLEARQMLFIPKGETYSVKKVSRGESKFIVINFQAKIYDAQPKLYDISQISDAYNDFKTINKMWLFNNSAGNYKCISLFYKILSDLCALAKNNYKSTSQKNIIQCSLVYLEEHIFDCGLNISDIVQKSGISGTYFRNIFTAIYGTTPKKYINNKRLTQARNILDGGEFNNIREVAEAVGFDDALYFGKIFKSRYGISPSEYTKHR